jgi:DNA polymerase-3 subunit gamma/tau
MNYTALYRKYRPLCFHDMVGQEHIVRTLQNQLKTGRVSHAYLFCGTRGTGKTSAAKIFARAVNCLSPIDGEPCNQCEMCNAALEGRSMNVIEIDAASNNGVDNIREIREEVKYPPAEGKYKVYIIDEVHMLSTGAFNALLKTLEEPPAYVMFLLATTDPQKIPPTILSRCQRFDFHRITTECIMETLEQYLEQEGVLADKEAIRYISRLGDGSMRDALSILDQCIAFYSGERLTLEKVLDIVGSVDDEVFFSMADAIGERNTAACMEMVEKLLIQGKDIGQFVLELIAHYRNLLVAATIPNPELILDMPQETKERLKNQAQKFTPEQLIFWIQDFSKLQGEMKYVSNERILLETQLIRLCSAVVEASYDSIAARLSQLEQKIQEKTVIQVVSSVPKAEAAEKPKPKRKPPALKEDQKAAIDSWEGIKESIDDILLRNKLDRVELKVKGEEDSNLYLVCDYPALKDMIEKQIDEVSQAMEKTLGKEFSLRTISKEDYTMWYETTYGSPEKMQEDSEFESLLGSYFPEAEFQE